MKKSKKGILSKINTLKLNHSIKYYANNATQNNKTPRQPIVKKSSTKLMNNTSTKIKVNILNNEENINKSNSILIKKSKSKPKKNILTVNKSFNSTIRNKNKKNDINFNSSINTFFTTQNDNKGLSTTSCTNYNNINTENTNSNNINVNSNKEKKELNKKKAKKKIIKKRKSFGYNNNIISNVFTDNENSKASKTNINNTNTNNVEKSETKINKIKRTKPNCNIRIKLNKNFNLNHSSNNIKINKINNDENLNLNNISKKLNIKKITIDNKENSNTKSKINIGRRSIDMNSKLNQDLSPIKPKKNNNKENKKNITNNYNNNNSEYKKRNKSVNLFGNNNKNKNLNLNKKINKSKDSKKTINIEENKKTTKNDNKTDITLNKTKSSKSFKYPKDININLNKSKNKAKISDKNKNKTIEKEKDKDKEIIINKKTIENNLKLLSISPKTSERLINSKDDDKDKDNNNSNNINNKIIISPIKKQEEEKNKDDNEEFLDKSLQKKSISISNFNSKIIIKFEDLITYDSFLDKIISSISEKNSNNSLNETSEFFSFYYHSSLNNILSNFFSKKNKILINSGHNLFLFSVMVLYHLSLNQKMYTNLIDDIKYIFDLIKLNFFFLIKKIELYYKDSFPIKYSDIFHQKFISYNNIINCNNEIDLITKYNKNCINITERMKIILNYYDRNKNNYYDEFSGIFKNISTITEQNINNYFYSYLYINPFNINNNKINDVNNINISYTKSNSNNIQNCPSIKDESDICYSDNMSFKPDKSDNERELLSVKSYKSSNYYGKLNQEKIINCDNCFYYNIENNIYEIDSDGRKALEIMQMIKDYEISKVQSPFLVTKSKKKYTLVLDLDETLIHLRQKKSVVNIKNDVDINIKINSLSDFELNEDINDLNKNKYLLQFRVGLFSFLTLLKPFYEIISFTSATKEYADVIINEIEKKRNFFDYKFYREHCVIFKDTFVKDIRRIGRDLSKIIIVDNNENNFVLNKENGIKIKPYYGDDDNSDNKRKESSNYNGRCSLGKKNDNTLLELKKILIMIYKDNYDDLREALKDYDELIKNKVTMDIQ